MELPFAVEASMVVPKPDDNEQPTESASSGTHHPQRTPTTSPTATVSLTPSTPTVPSVLTVSTKPSSRPTSTRSAQPNYTAVTSVPIRNHPKSQPPHHHQPQPPPSSSSSNTNTRTTTRTQNSQPPQRTIPSSSSSLSSNLPTTSPHAYQNITNHHHHTTASRPLTATTTTHTAPSSIGTTVVTPTPAAATTNPTHPNHNAIDPRSYDRYRRLRSGSIGSTGPHIATTNTELLTLYDNVNPHFYVPPAATTTTTTTHHNQHQHQHHRPNPSITNVASTPIGGVGDEDDSFVTVCESDAGLDHSGYYSTHSTTSTSTSAPRFGIPPSTTPYIRSLPNHFSRRPLSYSDPKQPSPTTTSNPHPSIQTDHPENGNGNENEDRAIIGWKTEPGSYASVSSYGGVLSLLFSGTVTTEEYKEQTNHQEDGDGSDDGRGGGRRPSLVELCEIASRAARMASFPPSSSSSSSLPTSSSSSGVDDPVESIKRMIVYRTKAARAYRDASVLVKQRAADTEGGGGSSNIGGGSGEGGTLGLLAYSLLVLSNGQARIADSLSRTGVGGSTSSGGAVVTARSGAVAGGSGAGAGASGRKRQVKHGGTKRNHRNGDRSSRSSSAGGSGGGSSGSGGGTGSGGTGRKDDQRLRATIQASMGKPEPDITDSIFLGKAKSGSGSSGGGSGGNSTSSTNNADHPKQETNQTNNNDNTSNNNSHKVQQKNAVPPIERNPIDDMMELEQELKDMDMALEIGVDLDSITKSNNGSGVGGKKTAFDPAGSFCLVGGNSMSSSMMWASGLGGQTQPQQQQQQQQQLQQQQPRYTTVGNGTGGGGNVKTRANRPSPQQQQHHRHQLQQQQQQHPQQSNTHQTSPDPGLESSWWGQNSTLAQSTATLTNSTVNIRPSPRRNQRPPQQQQQPHHQQPNQQQQQLGGADTKQLVRLLDSLQTLTDENASLIGQMEEAQRARAEAKAARETMQHFKEEFKRRYARLRVVLEDRVRKDTVAAQSGGGGGSSSAGVGVGVGDLVSNSQYAYGRAEILKRDQTIQKLTADVKKEKEEGRKKDKALRQYEKFYNEVKARSAQKRKEGEMKKKLEEENGKKQQGVALQRQKSKEGKK